MEKQPVDDLFHRKLHDAEVTPGADVFARLQSRMGSVPLPVEEPKRQVAGWWYGIAAASVLFALGWWFAYQQPNVPSQATQPTNQTARADKSTNEEKTGETAIAQQRTQPQQNKLARQPESDRSERTQLENKPVQPYRTEEPIVMAQQTTKPTEQRTQTVGEGNRPATERTQGATVQPEEIRPNVPDELVAKQATPINAVVTPSTVPSQPTVKHSTERVVVMTIAEPAPINTLVQRPETKDAAPAQPSLTQLVAKVKQIKNGDVLVRATPAPRASEPRTGIGRLFNGVKESLRNEATLEP